LVGGNLRSQVKVGKRELVEGREKGGGLRGGRKTFRRKRVGQPALKNAHSILQKQNKKRGGVKERGKNGGKPTENSNGPTARPKGNAEGERSEKQLMNQTDKKKKGKTHRR